MVAAGACPVVRPVEGAVSSASDADPRPRPRRRPPPDEQPSPRARIVVLGDLMVDVVLAPTEPLVSATDVPGRVSLVQGGSAATTARWLARLGARSRSSCAVGRDAAGRALIDALREDGVVPGPAG